MDTKQTIFSIDEYIYKIRYFDYKECKKFNFSLEENQDLLLISLKKDTPLTIYNFIVKLIDENNISVYGYVNQSDDNPRFITGTSMISLKYKDGNKVAMIDEQQITCMENGSNGLYYYVWNPTLEGVVLYFQSHLTLNEKSKFQMILP